MNLRDYLASNNISATEFARRIGKNRVTVSRYLNGHRKPEPAMLVLIHEQTGGAVQPNDFFISPDTERAA